MKICFKCESKLTSKTPSPSSVCDACFGRIVENGGKTFHERAKFIEHDQDFDAFMDDAYVEAWNSEHPFVWQ